ncbi:TRAP transporter small permease [Evansella clarkii]|uniref:TRAP transporter small permease n=1 Tax=Evansella clarkii TaxID=79879 RepID=UPI001C470CCD|nr:TRAP transporter small permease [Evansella clarkii]
MLYVAGVAIVLCMLLIVGNAIMRLFTSPFTGTPEVAGWLTAIAISFVLGYTQSQKGHVYIDIAFEKFPPMIQRVVNVFGYTVSLVFFLIVTYQLLDYSQSMKNNGTLSQTMDVAIYPFIFMVALGFIGLAVQLVVDILDNVSSRNTDGGAPEKKEVKL